MRLAAQAKMGYYPTPEDVTPIIAKYLKRKREGLIRILDPCAGMGTALKQIGDGSSAETLWDRGRSRPGKPGQRDPDPVPCHRLPEYQDQSRGVQPPLAQSSL